MTAAAGGAARAVGAGEFLPCRRGWDDHIVPYEVETTNALMYAPFVLGRGQRDDDANGVVIGNSGAHGDVRCSRCSASDVEGDADVILS